MSASAFQLTRPFATRSLVLGRKKQVDAVIKALFAASEPGVWYDPSDMSTLFQDSAGTVPVTEVEQPVGRILDKSGRGNHAIQPTTTKRPVLQQDANGKYYLRFDGIDDALYTSSIDFTSTDKMTVVAGVRKLSDATGIILELGDRQTAKPGSSALASVSVYQFISQGSSSSAINGVSRPSPDTSVVSGIGNISGDIAAIRLNGTLATSTMDQGTGNYGNYPLYIGSRGGTSFPFNGHLYSLLIRGAQSTDAQIISAETYVNQKTGAY